MSQLTEKVEKIFQFLLLEGCKKYHGGRCTDSKPTTNSRTLNPWEELYSTVRRVCVFKRVWSERDPKTGRSLASECDVVCCLKFQTISECECTTACQQINLIDCRFIWLLADKTETALLSLNHGPWLLLILIFFSSSSVFFLLSFNSFFYLLLLLLNFRSVSTLYLFRLLNFEKWTDIATSVHFSKEKIKGTWLFTNYP